MMLQISAMNRIISDSSSNAVKVYEICLCLFLPFFFRCMCVCVCGVQLFREIVHCHATNIGY